MLNYIFKRLILIIPTLLGILAVNFIIIQAAPGGPVEKAIAQIKGNDVSVTSRFTSSGRRTSTKFSIHSVKQYLPRFKI